MDLEMDTYRNNMIKVSLCSLRDMVDFVVLSLSSTRPELVCFRPLRRQQPNEWHDLSSEMKLISGEGVLWHMSHDCWSHVGCGQYLWYECLLWPGNRQPGNA